MRTITDEQEQAGKRAARLRAEWELGDRQWADMLIHAFLNPEQDSLALREEQSAGDQ